METQTTTRAALACIVALATVVAGCGGGGPVDDFLTAPLFIPPNGVLLDQQLVVPKGRVLAFVAQPMNNSETLKERVTLSSEDTSIAGVDTTVEMNQFVVYGASVGHTRLTARDESGRTATPTFDVDVREP